MASVADLWPGAGTQHCCVASLPAMVECRKSTGMAVLLCAKRAGLLLQNTYLKFYRKVLHMPPHLTFNYREIQCKVPSMGGNKH